MENKSNGFENFPIHKFMEVLSNILSEKYGCKITITAIPKEQYEQETKQKAEDSAKKAG